MAGFFVKHNICVHLFQVFREYFVETNRLKFLKK